MSSNDYQSESANSHDPEAEEATVTIGEDTITRAVETLEICDEFLRAAGPGVHAELHTFLTRHTPPIDLGLFIDTLGLTGLLLRDRLEAGTPAPNAPTEQRAETSEQVTA